jgi:hypothetical protein
MGFMQCSSPIFVAYDSKKDYDIVKPILEEYDQRINVEQIDLKYQFQMKIFHFNMKEQEKDFIYNIMVYWHLKWENQF